jgi:hypothetical protein
MDDNDGVGRLGGPGLRRLLVGRPGVGVSGASAMVGAPVPSALWQAEVGLGTACLAAAIWMAATGRVVGARYPSLTERLLRAAVLVCIGLSSLSQAAAALVDHELLTQLVAIAWALAALGIGAIVVVRSRAQSNGGPGRD